MSQNAPTPSSGGKNVLESVSSVESVLSQEEVNARIVIEARTWLNTPFQHQGRIKGQAVDCAQFISRVIIAVVPGYENLGKDVPTNYLPQEDGVLLRRLLAEKTDFVETENRQAGDIMVFCDVNCKEPDVPRHMVFIEAVTATTTFVIDPTERGVRRHRLDAMFNRRIHSCWRVKVA